KHLGTGRGRDVLEGANILVVPMLNPDSAIGEEWVSGSILHPTTPNAPAELVERSKKLGAVVYESVEAKGWCKIAKYGGGSAETISRNGIAVEYGVATLLFEMRGMSD